MAELTPMMQQYRTVKERNPDCILFFRLGDFYEMFFEDALTASRELEITLTGKENQKIQRIKNAYLEGIYTVEEVKEYKKSVEDKIKNLSSRQVQLKQEKTKPRKENVKEKKNFLATLKSPAISEKECYRKHISRSSNVY